MGGEKVYDYMMTLPQKGSPPHGRGKAENAGTNRQENGITPAWAGKSIRAQSGYLVLEDHPRMGGEKSHAVSSWFR